MGARTKGYIYNKKTKALKKFLYNPTTFSDSRGGKYTNIESPGSSYPVTQYVGGTEKVITVELFLYDAKSSKVKDYINFLNQFLPTRGSRFILPPTLIYSFGGYVAECVLVNLDLEYQEFDINLQPTMAVAKLSLKVV